MSYRNLRADDAENLVRADLKASTWSRARTAPKDLTRPIASTPVKRRRSDVLDVPRKRVLPIRKGTGSAENTVPIAHPVLVKSCGPHDNGEHHQQSEDDGEDVAIYPPMYAGIATTIRLPATGPQTLRLPPTTSTRKTLMRSGSP